jgi:hypothetical protein
MGSEYFFRSLRNAYICTLAALRKNEKNLFKVPAYTRKDKEYYPSVELHTCRLKPCYRIAKDTMLLVGPEYRSLEVLHCDTKSCSLAAERLFEKDIAAISTAPERGIVAVRLDSDSSVTLYDALLNGLCEISLSSRYGSILPWAADRVFALAPSGNFLAYNLEKHNALPYVWVGSQVLVIIDCSDLKNPQEALVVQDTCCTEMLWSAKGLFLHTGEGGGALLAFSSHE